MQCARCLKTISQYGVHTCTPTDAFRKLERENEKLKANVAMLRDQYYELAGIAADVDAGIGFDIVCRNTLRRVMDALSSASSDAWLKKQKAMALDEAVSNIETMNAQMRVDVQSVVDALQQMAADLRSPESDIDQATRFQ